MDMSKFYSFCLQGNVLKAIDYLDSLETYSKDILTLKEKYEVRFLTGNDNFGIDSDDELIKNTISCYYRYFRSVLTNNSVKEAERSLAAELSKVLEINNISDLDEIESKLKNIFSKKGYSFLGGITPPFRGPYIWKNTQKKEYNISLPYGEKSVVIYFISEFLMLSWAHFATMGRYYSGGWAKPEGLYYVNNNNTLNTDSSDFKICFLKHEAQHLFDYDRFPNLNSKNLEYRAKLIELIYHPQPVSLIEKFIIQSKKDVNFPHSYAAYMIISELSLILFNEEYVKNIAKWENIEPKCLSKSAYQVFMKNTKDLLEVGNETEGTI